MDAPQNQKEEILTTWQAPSRPFKQRSRESYVTIVSIASLLGLILFVIEGIMPVFLIVALLFLYYVMSTVKPEELTYKITSQGIRIEQSLIPWEATFGFWFSNRFGSELLVVETNTLGGRLELVMEKGLKDKIKKEIEKHIPEIEATPNIFDKGANFLSKKLPLE